MVSTAINSSVHLKSTILPHPHGPLIEEVDGLIRVYKDGHVERPQIVPNVSTALPPELNISCHDIPIDNSTKTWARFYTPKSTTSQKLPLLIYFHGGGFCVGSAAWSIYHNFLANLSSKANCLILSVNYRLAPENPLPAAYEDAFTSLIWLKKHQSLLNFSCVFLAGDSAGANIAYQVGIRLNSTSRFPGPERTNLSKVQSGTKAGTTCRQVRKSNSTFGFPRQARTKFSEVHSGAETRTYTKQAIELNSTFGAPAPARTKHSSTEERTSSMRVSLTERKGPGCESFPLGPICTGKLTSASKPTTVKGVILIHPFISGETRTKSELVNTKSSALTVTAADTYWRLALPAGSSRDHPWCNPMSLGLSMSMMSLKVRVMVCVAEMDVLRDRNVELCEALEKCGTRVVGLVSEGVGHAFQVLGKSEVARERTRELVHRVKSFMWDGNS